jgi:peptide/nickel transport system permease protein
MLLLLFANPSVLSWFPASGIQPAGGIPPGSPLSDRLLLSLPYLILPGVAYVYASSTFIALITRSSVREILSRDFITTARAKGLGQRQVLYRHALRNALFPLITTFGNIFPAMVGGSVIIESIFSLPGMGSQILYAVYNQDYPTLAAIFTCTGLLTMTGFLVSDILYSMADPRVRDQMRTDFKTGLL